MSFEDMLTPVSLEDISQRVAEYEEKGNYCTGQPNIDLDELFSLEDFSVKPVIAEDGEKGTDNSRCSCSLMYTKRERPEGNARWSFYLNVPTLKQYTVNEFVMMMRQVKEDDGVLIHLPSMTTLTVAETLAAAIKHCASKKVFCAAPFIGDTTTAYVASFARCIVSCEYAMMEFDTPNIVGHGAHLDAVAGLESDLRRYVVMHNRLRDVGLMSEEDYEHIRKRQGRICIYGDELMKRIDAFNKANNAPANSEEDE